MAFSDKIIQSLEKIVGSTNLLLDEERMIDYSHDEFSLPEIRQLPAVVVKPGSTEEVAAIMKLAEEKLIPVVPRGGGTGLCGGCVPVPGSMVLSLERMNQVVEVDADNLMAVVEAGVRLGDFYQAIEAQNLFFPPHPGEESAMIGGLIATNAGGARAVKYGVVRNYVRGLEVVLPGGKIIRPGGKLQKNSTGYSLLHLIIGSEGTLGIITQAIIQLLPAPNYYRTLVIPFQTLDEAIEAVPALFRAKIIPLAVEFVPKDVIQITEKYLQKTWPSRLGTTDLMIILDAASEEEMDVLSERVAEVCWQQGALDVYVADSPAKQEEVLAIRSQIYEAIKAETIEILDIVVPRAEIPAHVRKVQEVAQRYGLWLPTFGHAADGNVHTHIMRCGYQEGQCLPLPDEQWKPAVDKVRAELYRDGTQRGGLISGEHGIGLVKKPYLSLVLTEVEIALMQGIKKVFDPRGICNPGKVV
ncbi:MAG: FAD-binding oxidoreductase [Candidatus Aminicenantes bacterium]|nr:MAG: FAD-binding oxidoreductase [Candidatus Aminicenantes bacterium]RLE04305.1 MAG: FAD-binding oxidoreductase [Candidatus Aminicenantes bacterium]